MTRTLRLTQWLMFIVTSLFVQAAGANEIQCGERIPVKDVQVLDMEEYVEQPDLFQQKLHEQAGDHLVMTQSPIQVKMNGNRVKAINGASSWAAHNGCDLLVLLGESVKEKRWQQKITTTRYLMVHLGKRKSH